MHLDIGLFGEIFQECSFITNSLLTTARLIIRQIAACLSTIGFKENGVEIKDKIQAAAQRTGLFTITKPLFRRHVQ